MEIILMLVIIVIILILCAISTNYNDYKFYKKTYINLKNMKFYKCKDLLVSVDDTFIMFPDNGFKLTEGHYLINNIVTWFDPYSFYWLLKYKRFFKENNF
jgi:hypothetical protein